MRAGLEGAPLTVVPAGDDGIGLSARCWERPATPRSPGDEGQAAPAGVTRRRSCQGVGDRQDWPAMNDLSLALLRRIDLAAEAPFELGRLRVEPALLQVEGGGAVQQLEPKVMQVLVLLHRARGQAVSRARLTEVCWGGVVVGDDSINRSISLARRAVSADPKVRVQTIPRVGYRLYVEGEAAAADRPERSRPGGKTVYAMLAVALVGALGAAAAYGLRERAIFVSGVRPLTRQPGFEGYPAASPDGSQVAYAAGPAFRGPRDILVRGLEIGTSQPVVAAATPADEYAPAWSPDGRRLAFVRRGPDACGIVSMAFPGGMERIVAACRSAPDGLAWLDADRIAFSDRPDDGPRRMMAASLGDGSVQPLTTPPLGVQGDDAPVVSPDGRQLLFRRTAALGSDDLFILDLKSLKERRLTFDGWKALGAAWSADSRTVYFTSNRGGDFGVWSMSARGGGIERVSPGVLPLGRLSASPRKDVLIAEAARGRSAIFTMSAGAPTAAVSDAAGMDWDPDIASDGALAFGSDRSGANELWIKPSGLAPARLTELKASFLHSPRFSPDGELIAFIGVVGGKSDVHLVRRDGSGHTVLTKDGAGKGRVAWTSRGDALIYTARTPQGWGAWRISATGGQPHRLPAADGVAVIQRWGPRIYARDEGSAMLNTLDEATGALAEARPQMRLSSMEGWSVAKDGVIVLEPTADARNQVVLHRWDMRRQVLGEVTPASRMTVAASPSGALFLPQQVEDDVDLVRLDINRR